MYLIKRPKHLNGSSGLCVILKERERKNTAIFFFFIQSAATDEVLYNM